MTREEIINEYLKEHRHDVLLNPYAGLLDFAKYLDEHSELPEGVEEAAWNRVTENGRFPISEFEEMRIRDIKFGAEWDRAKMMEKAVDADVNTYEDIGARKSWAEFVVEMPTKNLGDKVKVIVIPEEK